MVEEQHPFLPEQNYETDMSTYDFIYFVQDYTPFLEEYLYYMHETYIEYADIGYYNSFIDICNEINTNHGDDGTFERYRATLEPFMEWMTEECGNMNSYHEQNMRNHRAAIDQQQAAPEAAPTDVASRTRSKGPASGFEIPQSKRGRNAMTLEPIKQDAVRIKLSDGKEYTYDEVKHMWEWNKNITPYRHPYTEDDKNKIKEIIDFATKGGKKRRKTKKNKRNSRKTRKIKSKKSRKLKQNKKTRNKRSKRSK
jgi:hypothetical protein